MTIQTLDAGHVRQKARHIRVQVSTILTRWGLQPRFKRWRLTQDPGTGMIVLFGILNNRFIATHTSIPFGNYFDQRVLHDLANELQVQVVSCNSEDLRYAFILDRGQLGKLPTHIDFPFIHEVKPLVRVVYSSDNVPPMLAPPVDLATVGENHSLVHQGVGAFLKVFDDIQLRGEAASELSAQNVPDVLVIDEDEFKKRLAEREVNDQKIRPGVLSTK